MFRSSLLAVASLVFASPAFASVVMKIDPAASTVGWKGTKKLGSAHNGGVALKEGSITMDAKGQLKSGVLSSI